MSIEMHSALAQNLSDTILELLYILLHTLDARFGGLEREVNKKIKHYFQRPSGWRISIQCKICMFGTPFCIAETLLYLLQIN